MDIIISNSSDKPIYEQITTQINDSIVSGELAAGDRSFARCSTWLWKVKNDDRHGMRPAA